MIIRERRLPHFHAVETPIFITFRLHGSLPAGRRFSTDSATQGEAFVAMDRLLDQAATGPRYLAMPEIATILVNAILEGQKEGDYDSQAWVVMLNHVHLLITAHKSVSRVMQRLKGASAKLANHWLGRAGKPFWQDESYDRLVRNRDEFVRIKRYIEINPVKAGLAQDAAGYRWSSAHTLQVLAD